MSLEPFELVVRRATCSHQLASGRLTAEIVLQLQSRKVEEVAGAIGDGALLGSQHRSPRLSSEVQTAHARIQPRQGTSPATKLDDRLAWHGVTSDA